MMKDQTDIQEIQNLRINKNLFNIIRTTQRNNIDLKQIADNKANILMSVNAIMITFLIPIVLAHLDIIVIDRFYIPIGFLAITCLVTIFISANVLRPFSSDARFKNQRSKTQYKSPFFFGNYSHMDPDEYYKYFVATTKDQQTMVKFIIQDLHFYGKILSIKYRQITTAYLVFKIGLVISVISLLIMIQLV